MFKIKKNLIIFGLNLASKALAQRQQEQIIYRSVRIKTVLEKKKPYVYFESNSGHNAIRTALYEIQDYKKEIDVLVDCVKLMEIVTKATVEDIFFEMIDEENILVTANGENKLRFLPGKMTPEFPVFKEENLAGVMKTKRFVDICKYAVPFSTDDVHKQLTMGLCIDQNRLHATDEVKQLTISNIGLKLQEQLNFNSVAKDMVALFSDDLDLKFYFGAVEGAQTKTHLVLTVDNYEMYIIKYQTEYASDILREVNEQCEKFQNFITIAKSSTLEVLSRILVFQDANDILSLTPIKNDEGEGLILEVTNLDTGETGKEVVEASLEIEDEFYDKKILVSLKNFKILLETLPFEAFRLSFKDTESFLAFVDGDYTAWLTIKKYNAE